MYEIIEDETKFKKMDTDPTIFSGLLQRFILKDENKIIINDKQYTICPTG